MQKRNIAEEDMVLLLGSPRSGTTWLAKILDSHPDVLYRHEPDKVLRDPIMQKSLGPGDIAGYLDSVSAYLHDLAAANYLNVVGVLPLFRKSYQPAYVHYLRTCAFFVLAAAGRLGAARWTERIRFPDMVVRTPPARVKLVIKSIASQGRAGAMAAAVPQARIVYIIRDPLGQIASMRRGIRLGKFEKPVPLDECLETGQAASCGLTRESFQALPQIEQLAWHWALRNRKALQDLAENPRAMIIRYDALRADPIGEATKVLQFAGLPWDRQTASFIHASTHSRRPDGYYRIYKNADEKPDKWRAELSSDEQMAILRVVRDTGMDDFVTNKPECRPQKVSDPVGERPLKAQRALTRGSQAHGACPKS